MFYTAKLTRYTVVLCSISCSGICIFPCSMICVCMSSSFYTLLYLLPYIHFFLFRDGRIVTFGCQEEADKRKPKRAYRRLQNEPRKPFVVSKNPAKPRSQVVGVRPRFSRHPGTSHTKTRGKPLASVSKQSVSTKTPSAETTNFGNTHNVPKTTHPWCTQLPYLPYPPVSLSGPPPAPVSTNGDLPPPWVPLFPLLNGWLSENTVMATSTATTVSNAPLMFVPLSVHQKLLEERTLDTAAVSLTTPTVTSSNTTTQSKADMQSVMVTASANPTIEQKQTEDGSVKDIEKCLLEEITNIEQRLNSAGVFTLCASFLVHGQD